MGLVFWLTFGVIGAALQGLMEDGIAVIIASADAGLKAFGTNDVVRSLAVDGVLTGVGSVLTFLPIIVVLFLFLSILEDSGYMARVAFVMDKVLRRFGLSGRSFVPMLVGFGCTVPAIMSTRTLPSEHDRKMTVMLTPFMSCSAKLPVYGLLCGAFFPQATVPAMVSLYLIGIAVGCIAALVLNRTAFKGDPVPFIMELPNYRLPSVKTTVMLAWDKAKDFITKAFTIIFAATVVIWFLQTFDIRFNVVADQSQSLLAGLGSIIAPVLTPLGFGDCAPRRRSSRTHRQGERHLDAHGAFGRNVARGAVNHVFAVYRLRVPGLYAAVPALRGVHRRRQERAGHALCRCCVRVSGDGRLDRGVCRAFGGHIAGFGLVIY